MRFFIVLLAVVFVSGCGSDPAWIKFGVDLGARFGEIGGKYGCSKIDSPDEKQLCLDGVTLAVEAAKKAPIK